MRRLQAWWREACWFVNGVLGANTYQQYLAHHFGTGCAGQPLSERAFWRQHLDAADRRPEARCC